MRERLQKRAKVYGSSFFIFWVLLYFAQRLVETVKGMGGTDPYTAFFIVALQPLFLIGVLFCGVMWLIVRSKIKKLPQ